MTMVGPGHSFVGRSAIECHLVIQDATGKEIANKKIKVSGNVSWGSWKGANTQRRQAVESLDQRLLEEIEKLVAGK